MLSGVKILYEDSGTSVERSQNTTTFTNWEQIYHFHISYYIIAYFICTLDCAMLF